MDYYFLFFWVAKANECGSGSDVRRRQTCYHIKKNGIEKAVNLINKIFKV
jgi:hypothetical protein